MGSFDAESRSLLEYFHFQFIVAPPGQGFRGAVELKALRLRNIIRAVEDFSVFYFIIFLPFRREINGFFGSSFFEVDNLLL